MLLKIQSPVDCYMKYIYMFGSMVVVVKIINFKLDEALAFIIFCV